MSQWETRIEPDFPLFLLLLFLQLGGRVVFCMIMSIGSLLNSVKIGSNLRFCLLGIRRILALWLGARLPQNGM